MKISLCAFADEASKILDGQIKALKRNNIKYIEIRNVNGKSVANLSLSEAEEIRKTLNDNGISVWSIGSPIGKVDINSDLDAYMQKVEHVCKIAVAMGTDKIRMFSFFNAQNSREKVMEYLLKMVNIAKTYGVKLYHENEKDIYGDTLERVLDIMQTVSELEHIYDPANFLQCGQDAETTLQALHKTTGYFHIKDVISQTGQLVPAGYGDGNIKKLIDMVSGETTFTLEPHLTVFDGYKNIDNTEMKHKFTYASSDEAFDSAVCALKTLLLEAGYKEVGGVFSK